MTDSPFDEPKGPSQPPEDIYSYSEQQIGTNKPPAKASEILISFGSALFCFLLAYISYWTLGEQDSSLGLAARNREPSETGILLGYLGIVTGILFGIFLLGVAFLAGGRKPKMGKWTIYPAAATIVPGALALYAYFSLW